MFLNWRSQTGVIAQEVCDRPPPALLLEHNPFFLPCYLGPAMRNLAGGDAANLNLLANDRSILTAPFVLATRFRGLPIRTLSVWTHPFQFLSTPLVERAQAKIAITALLEAFDTLSDQPALLILDDIRLDGEFFAALRSQLTKQTRPWHELQRFERAILCRGISFEQHLAKQLSAKRRKELERKRADLQKLGQINFAHLQHYSELNLWLDQFLQIEASGWKGRAGSALAQDQSQRAFFVEACHESYQAGSLRILRMSLADQPLAMHISLTSQRHAFAIKIAYDDAFARYSPGALLELENMRRVLDLGEFDFMDSCALPNHELFRRLWSDRSTIGSIAIAADSSAARTLLAGVRWAQKIRRFIRT